MRDFIYLLMNPDNVIPFEFQNYNTIFLREQYDTFYLFFFLEQEEELRELQKKTADIYQHIKTMDKQYYDTAMDKNTVCIFCLELDNEKYYSMERQGEIDNIVKLQCAIEEDLAYFKKNVLLYSEQMGSYAQENVGKFHEMCKQWLGDEMYQHYKKHRESDYQFEFLVNLFVKIPFLNFSKYQNNGGKEYKTPEECISEICKKKDIDVNEIKQLMEELEERIEKEEDFYSWLDNLVEEEKKGERQNENTESGNK